MVYKSSTITSGGGGSVTEITPGTGLDSTPNPITATGTIFIADKDPNTLAGFDATGEFSQVDIGTGLSLSGGTLTATGDTTIAIGEEVTGGTAGSVLFVGTGPVLAQDNANLFWDDTNNRLGVGTATPSATVHIINTSASDSFRVDDEASDTSPFVIDAGGNVGIGNSTPSAKMHLVVNDISNILKVERSSIGGISFNVGNGAYISGGNTIVKALSGNNAIAFNSSTDVNALLIDYTNNRIGIGTTAPTQKLEVSASSAATALAANNIVRVANTNAVNGGITSGVALSRASNGGTMTDYAVVQMGSIDHTAGSEDAFLRFGTIKAGSMTEDVRITAGNVGIGTTSPAAKLDIADTALAGSGSLAGSALNIAQTWNTTGGPTAIKLNVTDTASHVSSSLLMDLQVGGSSKFSVTKAGQVSTGSNILGGANIYAGGGSRLGWNGSSRMIASSNGVIRLTNSGETDFSLLQFGGTTSSFPAIKRNGTGLDVRLADDSADAAITAAAGTFSGALSSGANSGTLGSLKLYGSTSGDVTVKAAAAAGTATVFQLPADNGTNTYVLQTDGAGVTSWVPAGGGGSGITRTVSTISSPTTAGAAAVTDYVYFVSGTTTLTLPTAVGNTNLYTVKRTGVNTVTIDTTGGETIDGSATQTLLTQYESMSFVSDGTNWGIV